MLVHKLFHMSFWYINTNFDNLLDFFHIYSLVLILLYMDKEGVYAIKLPSDISMMEIGSCTGPMTSNSVMLLQNLLSSTLYRKSLAKGECGLAAGDRS